MALDSRFRGNDAGERMNMRFLVLGAGAVGGYFGGRLAEAGRDVTFLVRGARANALAEHGIRVESPLGDFTVPVKVATADRVGGPFDVVLLTAKHYDLGAAIDAIRPGVGSETAVLPLLNGLVHLERLDRAFGPGSVLGGVAYVGAALLPDGSIRHHNRLSGIAFGERGGGISERALAIEREFAGTPVSAPANPNILQEMWEKFVMMGAMAGMNCLLRGNIGEIAATEEGRALMTDALAECQAVAAASGYAPRPQSRERVQAMLTEPGSINSASMRQDLEAGRPTEADAIVGDMLRRARGFGISTPLLRAAWCCLQVHENRLARG
jgi:2-dehydropantoate 2-reductase